jgi:hypothetical protein
MARTPIVRRIAQIPSERTAQRHSEIETEPASAKVAIGSRWSMAILIRGRRQ